MTVLVIVIVVALVLLAAVAFIVTRGRRGGGTTTAPPTEVVRPPTPPPPQPSPQAPPAPVPAVEAPRRQTRSRSVEEAPPPPPTAADWAACAGSSAGPWPRCGPAASTRRPGSRSRRRSSGPTSGWPPRTPCSSELKAKVASKEISGGDDLLEALGDSIRGLLRHGGRTDAALRRQGRHARRLADRRGERRGQDDHDRQAGPARVSGRSVGAPGRRRHLPGRRGRAAGHVGRTHRHRDRAGRRGRRPQRRRLRRRRSGRPPGATTWCWPTRPGDSTPR